MRARVWVLTAVVVVVVVAGLAVAAIFAWPHARLASSNDALARVVLPGFAGRVTTVEVSSAAGAQVPVKLQGASCGRRSGSPPAND